MNPIRPGLSPHVQPSATPRTPDGVRTAAQRAFFEIAAGRSAAAQPAQAAAAPAAAATRLVQEAGRLQGAAPTRPLRPGSLLDIKV